MQQFTVPQFIDVEDKIIGPITARQFVIMLGGFLLIALCYRIFSFGAFVVIGLTIFGLSGVFAFLKINGMPFHFFILNFVETSQRPSKRVWSNRLGANQREEQEKEPAIVETQVPPKRHFTTSRLAELSLVVDTRGVYRGEDVETDANITPEEKPNKGILLIN